MSLLDSPGGMNSGGAVAPPGSEGGFHSWGTSGMALDSVVWLLHVIRCLPSPRSMQRWTALGRLGKAGHVWGVKPAQDRIRFCCWQAWNTWIPADYIQAMRTSVWQIQHIKCIVNMCLSLKRLDRGKRYVLRARYLILHKTLHRSLYTWLWLCWNWITLNPDICARMAGFHMRKWRPHALR